MTWLQALFDDLHWGAPHGISWSIDRAEPPLRLRVTTADGPTSDIHVADDRPLTRIAVIEQVQRHIDAVWDVGLPPCPAHGEGLRPVRSGAAVGWRCPQGDVICELGGYDELLWPPGPEHADLLGPLFGHRLQRWRVKEIADWDFGDGTFRISMREGGDEAGLRAAAAPFAVELRWINPIGWDRRQEADGESITVTNASMHLARLTGVLLRSPTGGLLVGDAEVEFIFPHRIGARGEALLLDGDGRPFAYEGDRVSCGGGFHPTSPVEGAPSLYRCGRITRLAPPGA